MQIETPYCTKGVWLIGGLYFFRTGFRCVCMRPWTPLLSPSAGSALSLSPHAE